MNKTAKRVLAPIVLLAGVSSAALMGTAPAHANSGGFIVVNGPLVGEVTGVDVSPVVNILVKDSPILSDNDISVLENDLNNTKIDVQDIDATILNFYKSINVPINVSDIIVKL